MQGPDGVRSWDIRRAVAVGLAAAVVLAGTFVTVETILDRGGEVSLAVPGKSRASEKHSDAELQAMAVGTWRDFHHGRRTLTLRADGTATMVVELSGIKARLFTPRLVLDIVWSIEDGKMHRRTTGGRPADKVAFVNQRAGVAVAEPIVSLDEDRMVLRDQNAKQTYKWRRVKTGQGPPER